MFVHLFLYFLVITTSVEGFRFQRQAKSFISLIDEQDEVTYKDTSEVLENVLERVQKCFSPADDVRCKLVSGSRAATMRRLMKHFRISQTA